MHNKLVMKTGALQNPIVKNILSALAVAFFGFLLLNLTFIFDAIYQGIVRGLIGIFLPLAPEKNFFWFPLLMHLSFVFIIGIISWIVFRSKLGMLFKAIYMTVPVAVALVTCGMFLYTWPVLSYTAGVSLWAGTLYYLYRTKQPWLYYFALILIGIVMLFVVIKGIEI